MYKRQPHTSLICLKLHTLTQRINYIKSTSKEIRLTFCKVLTILHREVLQRSHYTTPRSSTTFSLYYTAKFYHVLTTLHYGSEKLNLTNPQAIGIQAAGMRFLRDTAGYTLPRPQNKCRCTGGTDCYEYSLLDRITQYRLKWLEQMDDCPIPK